MINSNEKVRSGLYSYLRSLSRRRADGVVTAADAHTYLSRQGISDLKVRTRLSYINSVLRKPDFRSVGSQPSSRESARGRMITEWRYRVR